MPDVLMPRLVEHMEQGVIARWLHAEGESIDAGDELVEIETDKATTVIEAEHGGVLSILAAEGDTVAVGVRIATVGEADRTSRASAALADDSGRLAAANGSATTRPAALGRHRASPVARRMARERGIILEEVSGSGPQGRILKADVLSYATRSARNDDAGQRVELDGPAARVEPRAVVTIAAEAKLDAPPAQRGEQTAHALSAAQRIVARRMSEAKSTVPDFAVSVEVDMSSCLKLRADLQEQTREGESAPSINDLIVKASARALRVFPRANASYRGDEWIVHDRVNIGVAVAGDESLIVPTVFDADRLSLAEIAREMRRLASRVRDGSISPPELAGGTFTVSNLGMYGVSSFTAIVNPPQACILAVAGIVERPVARDGEIVLRPMMTMTLGSDHRILYGADAARFLGLVRDSLERPLAMAL